MLLSSKQCLEDSKKHMITDYWTWFYVRSQSYYNRYQPAYCANMCAACMLTICSKLVTLFAAVQCKPK